MDWFGSLMSVLESLSLISVAAFCGDAMRMAVQSLLPSANKQVHLVCHSMLLTPDKQPSHVSSVQACQPIDRWVYQHAHIGLHSPSPQKTHYLLDWLMGGEGCETSRWHSSLHLVSRGLTKTK